MMSAMALGFSITKYVCAWRTTEGLTVVRGGDQVVR
jgi:hypothetical protein